MWSRRFLPTLLGVALLVAACGDDPAVEADDGSGPDVGVADASPWPDVDLDTVSIDHGCDLALAGSDADQTVGVVLYAPSADIAAGTVVDLAADDWRGSVQLGTDLFRAWCASVLDDETRRPFLDHEATVTGGTLTFETAADADGCGGPDVRVTVAGLTVTDEDGGVHDLGSVDLSSSLWACPVG